MARRYLINRAQLQAQASAQAKQVITRAMASGKAQQL